MMKERLRILGAARFTWIVLGVLVLVQLPVSRITNRLELIELYERFGLSRDGLGEGRFYEFLSHALLHGGWGHLLMNLAAMMWLGAGAEWIVGRKMTAMVFLCGVLLGGIAHLALVPSAAEASLLVGASGGVVALLLLLTGLMPESRIRWLGLSVGNIGLGMLIASGLLALMHPALNLPLLGGWGAWLDEVSGSALFRIAHACHFGGGLAGAFAARWLLRPRVTRRQLEKQRARREGPAGPR